MAKQLTCPVCAVPTSSLQILNDHLDKEHPIGDDESNSATYTPIVVEKTVKFSSLRRRYIEKLVINRTKLELRLAKLLIGIQNLSNQGSSGSMLWNRQHISAIRNFEQDTVNWEDESNFSRCRFCGQKFSLFVRKHHCRICGLVTCGDVERECSLEVPALFLAQKLGNFADHYPALNQVTTDFPIRVCTECRSTLFSHSNYEDDRNSEPPKLIRLHYQLAKIQTEITSLLPQFETLLVVFASGKVPGNDVNKIRKSRQTLLQLFSKYDTISRRVKDIQVETDTETRLKNQILAKAALFLETTMIPLQGIPQAEAYQEPRFRNKHEAKALQDKLVVLEEQRFLLEKQLKQAKENRQFDVVSPIETSLVEITHEVGELISHLGQFAPTG